MQGRRLIKNTIFMTLTSILLRLFGLGFQVFLSNSMGAAGIGLFQLVMSVNSFAATLAISGIRFATTRLVSEELGKGNTGNIGGVVRRCLIYAVIFGTAAALLMQICAKTVAIKVIGEVDTLLSLRILSISLPFLSCGAALSGYFTGSCQIIKSAAAAISEQVCRIAVSILLISIVPERNIEILCACVVLGGVTGEIFSFFVALFLYKAEHRKEPTGKNSYPNLTKRIVGVAMPLALAAYARTALNTVQNLLIPRGLKASGATAEMALAGYGMIQGMVFPVITFPMVLFASVSELLVPELTEEQVRGRNDRISQASTLLLKLCFLFSAGVMGLLLCFSDELGEVIYSSAEVGAYIRAFAFLMPIMYLDNITDGMLRGLGQHLFVMRVNILDSIVSTLLIWFILPRFAIKGYVFILYASEIFNFALSLGKLAAITKLSGFFKEIAAASISVIGAWSIERLIVNFIGGAFSGIGLALSSVAFLAIYFLMLLLLKAVNINELSLS